MFDGPIHVVDLQQQSTVIAFANDAREHFCSVRWFSALSNGRLSCFKPTRVVFHVEAAMRDVRKGWRSEGKEIISGPSQFDGMFVTRYGLLILGCVHQSDPSVNPDSAFRSWIIQLRQQL